MGVADTPENKPHKRDLCPYLICRDPFATQWVHCADCGQAYHQKCAHHHQLEVPFICDRCGKRLRDKLSLLEPVGGLLPRAALAPVTTNSTPIDTSTRKPRGRVLAASAAPAGLAGAGDVADHLPVKPLTSSRSEIKPPLPPWLKPHEPLFGWEWREIVVALATQFGKAIEPSADTVAHAQTDLSGFYRQLCQNNLSQSSTYKGLKKTVYDLSALSRSPRSLRAIVEISKTINPDIIEDYLAFYEACVAQGVANVPPPAAPGTTWSPPLQSPKLEPAPAIVTKKPLPPLLLLLLPPKRPRFDHPSPVLEVEEGEVVQKPAMAPWEFQVLALALAAQYHVDTRTSAEWERRVAADPDECLEFMYQLSLVSPSQELLELTFRGSYMDKQSQRPLEKWRQLGKRLTPVVVPFYLTYFRICVAHDVEPKMLI